MATFANRKCFFCEEGIKHIDYKRVKLLRKFTTQYGKITPRYYSGTCIKHQKPLAKAIKLAREVALLPYIR